MMRESDMFRCEAQLVRSGRRLLTTAYRDLGVDIWTKTEVKGPGVIPDLVFYSKRDRAVSYVITMEFKLRDWRKALSQAFRHRNFVNEAYVVLDHARSAVARDNLRLFEMANVGLATVERGAGLYVWKYPVPSLPFSQDFSQHFAQRLLSRKTLPTDLPYTRSIRGGVSLNAFKGIFPLTPTTEDSEYMTA